DQTFTTTAPGAPSTTTSAASAIGSAGATLNGLVNPQGVATTYQFQWGAGTSYGQTSASASLSADTVDHAVSLDLTGLTPNTTYHYRLAASGNAGSTTGADQTLTTVAVAPAATTGTATAVGTDAATVGATVNAANSATSARFDWGPTAAYGRTTT